MPRQNADPLLPVPCRLPASLVARFHALAREQGVTVSDVLRAHLTPEESKPIGKPVPRKRPPLAKVSGTDPALMRQLVGIGNNINQVAKMVNSAHLSVKPVDAMEILIRLRSMEQSLEKLCPV